MVVLMAARASRLENQDAIDGAIVSMLADPKEVQVQRYFTRLTTLKPFYHCILLRIPKFYKFADVCLINIHY